MTTLLLAALAFRTFTTEIDVEFATPADARAAERIEPSELGGLADYALGFTHSAKDGVRVLKPDTAHPLPTVFGRLGKALAYDADAGRLTLTLKNPTEGDLEDVDLTLRLPLAWKDGLRRVNRPRLACGETWTETFEIGSCPPSEGDLYFVVQVDAKTSPTTRGRWYATEIVRRPPEPTIARGLPDCWLDYYVNGKPLSFVVEPTDGSWFEIKDILDANGVFTYEGDAPSKWKVSEGVWLHGYWANDWYDETVRVKAIDSKKRTITLAAKPKYGICRKPHISPRRFRRVARPNPCRYQVGEIEMVTNRAPLLTLVGVTNRVVSGRVFEKSLGDGLLLSNCVNVTVRNCTFRYLRGIGVRIVGGSGCRVENCRVEDTGCGGVFLTGGDRPTLTPGNHEVTGCVIRRFSSHQLTYTEGVHLEGVGNRATHNFLADTPHQAAFMRGNDLVFADNIVSNAVCWGDDSAALYMGRDWSCTGNVIERNLFIDIGSPRGHGNCAVYFDDGEGLGDVVRSNRFVRCGFPCGRGFGAIHLNGGFGILAEDNVFVDCERAFGSTVWSPDYWLKDSRKQMNRLFRNVNVTNEPYASRYPYLKPFADMEKVDYANARCIARNNTLIDCRSMVFRTVTKWNTNENNVVRFTSPQAAARWGVLTEVGFKRKDR